MESTKRWQSKRQSYLRNKDKVLTRQRQSALSGRWKGLHKRAHPSDDRCELCKQYDNRLGYHHWDDDNPSLGLWLCSQCHKYAEGWDRIEESLDYLALKARIVVDSQRDRLL